jgi:hypothetical protein
MTSRYLSWALYTFTNLLLLSRLVLCDVVFVHPLAGQKFAAGSAIEVSFRDSGEVPSISDLKSYSMYLCAGGDEDDVCQMDVIVSILEI